MSDDSVHVREKGKGEEGEYVYKICIVGEPGVGKTSLLRKYVKDQFEYQHIKTVGVDISKQPLSLKINGNNIEVILMFWDMAGQMHFHLLHKVYLNGASGIIIAFDLTRPISLVNAESWKKRVAQYGYGNLPTILVGTKADLKQERKITEVEIKKQQENLGIPEYIETSSLHGENVNLLFERIAIMTYDSKKNK